MVNHCILWMTWGFLPEDLSGENVPLRESRLGKVRDFLQAFQDSDSAIPKPKSNIHNSRQKESKCCSFISHLPRIRAYIHCTLFCVYYAGVSIPVNISSSRTPIYNLSFNSCSLCRNERSKSTNKSRNTLFHCGCIRIVRANVRFYARSWECVKSRCTPYAQIIEDCLYLLVRLSKYQAITSLKHSAVKL